MSGFRYGTSWPGRRPGTRHWVSGPLWLWVLGWLFEIPFRVLLVLLLGEVWLVAEFLVLLASSVLILCNLGQGLRLDWRRAYWHRLRRFELWSLLVPEKGER